MKSIVINRPLHGTRHLSIKGAPEIMEDGSVCLTCKDKDTGGKYWIVLTPDVVQEMATCLKAP